MFNKHYKVDTMCHIIILYTSVILGEDKKHLILKIIFILSSTSSYLVCILSDLSFDFTKRGRRAMEEFRYTYARLCKDNHVEPQECVLSYLKRYFTFPRAWKNIVGLFHLFWIDSNLNTLITVFPSLSSAVMVIIAANELWLFPKIMFIITKYIFHRGFSFIYICIYIHVYK